MTRVKGIVLTVGNNQATILTDQGEFKKVKTHGFIQPGEVWQGYPMLMWKYACAAAVLLFLAAGGVEFFSVTASARVSSNVELGLNRWDRVISVKALNNNGKQIIKKLDLKGKKVEVAVEELTEDNNFDKKRPVVTIVFNNSNNAKAKKRLEEKINATFQGDINKKQPYKKEIKTKTKNNDSSGEPVQSAPGKSSINNEEKTDNYDIPKPEQGNSNIGKDNGNFQTTVPPRNNNVKNTVNNNKSFINMLRSAPFKNSIKFHKNIPNNNDVGKNK